ncbi:MULTISPECIES: ABC transporter ATP-binding protein [unclassified Arthrobacter]|uniref:ABC transporter ATP-binding protein n=1 Tax=unclassified Arthrobacter TaxID=235627 RepID=UPI001490DECA|nr:MULTISPECIES: ABC transporter ATP-binding protein [unclassified Arthrobacter]MBE0008905.1 ABC transporter ATP-binding protein [Arthrobacter sp. AET 35A]NOJ62615.1 ABC transporter ATP-binding protein [Arthrobacter sp. 147(2020)]
MTHTPENTGAEPIPAQPLLELRDLAITFTTSQGDVEAVKNARLTIMPGETVAIVGESGSGKSTTALAAIGLLPANGRVSGGQVLFDGEDITHADEKRIVELRGSSIGMVPQDPMSNLNPVWKIGFQVKETLRTNGLPHGKKDVAQVLAEAGLPDAESRANQYPHEFSGGMRQRALIAIGLSCRPRLLIADEPTSALDVTVQRQILDHLDSMTRDLGTAVLLITHDLGLAAERAHKVIVMYKGKVVEAGPAMELLTNPRHAYTQKLVASAPSLASRRIESAKKLGVATTEVLAPEEPAADGGAVDKVIEVKDLTKVFKIRGSWGKSTDFKAVDGVSFSIARGTTTAVVGESGSGKSTVARMVLGLEPATGGSIDFDGVDITTLSRKKMFDFRRRVQPIFQDPYGSLDPMYNIFRTIEEPLRVHGIGDAKSREQKVRDLLEQVALPASMMRRFPNELSGGQRQRVAIARALALDPEVVICDEAVSALDVLVQAQILNLLADLQAELGLSYLFITHDLAVVRQIADHVCVMEKGKLVEQGSTDDVFDHPQTPYTRALLDAIPGAGLVLPPDAA